MLSFVCTSTNAFIIAFRKETAWANECSKNDEIEFVFGKVSDLQMQNIFFHGSADFAILLGDKCTFHVPKTQMRTMCKLGALRILCFDWKRVRLTCTKFINISLMRVLLWRYLFNSMRLLKLRCYSLLSLAINVESKAWFRNYKALHLISRLYTVCIALKLNAKS